MMTVTVNETQSVMRLLLRQHEDRLDDSRIVKSSQTKADKDITHLAPF